MPVIVKYSSQDINKHYEYLTHIQTYSEYGDLAAFSMHDSNSKYSVDFSKLNKWKQNPPILKFSWVVWLHEFNH